MTHSKGHLHLFTLTKCVYNIGDRRTFINKSHHIVKLLFFKTPVQRHMQHMLYTLYYNLGRYWFLTINVIDDPKEQQWVSSLLLLCSSPEIHNSFIKYMSEPWQLTLNLSSMQPCNLNKWYKEPWIEHHGGLKSRVFTLIFHFSAALNQPSAAALGERVSAEIEGKGCYM